jgi:GT2 family glycosyltransferase
MSASLSISIVTFAPDLAILGEALRTLGAALVHARKAGSLGAAELTLIDNGPGDSFVRPLHDLLGGAPRDGFSSRLLSGQGNIGYGRANNLALLASHAEFHLVMNPDVTLAQDAIHEALRFMAQNSKVVILAPDARDASGEPLYLCKRYPSAMALGLRGLGVKGLFRKKLESYEMRDLPRDRPSTGIPLLSGSFMFCRRAVVAELGGFSPEFFLYFEDFDLSLRAAARGELAWVPAVRITHRGGHAARKGWAHVRLFVSSAVKFFNRHGWKWA